MKKRWRKVRGESGPFASYAVALVTSGEEMPWIPVALIPHSWHVELMRGLDFDFREYTSEYGEHDHCVQCFKTLMPPETAFESAEHRGFVTRYQIPDGTGKWQWHWICSDCFEELHAALQWRAMGHVREAI